MKKLGGYQVLDVTSVSMTEIDSETYTAFTDDDILTSLKDYLLPYILDDNLGLKPCYIRLVNSDTGRKGVVLAELSKETDSEVFNIYAKMEEYTLIIHVEFTQDEDTKEWYIDTGDAKWILVSDLTKLSADYETLIDDELIQGKLVDICNDIENLGDIEPIELNKITKGNNIYVIQILSGTYENTWFIGICSNKTSSLLRFSGLGLYDEGNSTCISLIGISVTLGELIGYSSSNGSNIDMTTNQDMINIYKLS